MLTKLAEFIYTKLFKPAPIRKLVNKIILVILPSEVRYGNAIIKLNPSDPVVSGALLFHVYEREEISFLKNNLRSGDLFIDIGANIGFYTAMAMQQVGKKGTVIALEPDPESYRYLEQTIDRNGPCDVRSFNVAASSSDGSASLFKSESNRGDNRLHEFDNASDKIEIKTVNVDSLVKRLLLNIVDKRVFIKIDIQGGEGLAIQGMKNILIDAKNLVLMMEFWPQGLSNMQSDPGLLLSTLEDAGLTLYELGTKCRLISINDKQRLINRLSGRKYTNIIGLKARKAPVNI